MPNYAVYNRVTGEILASGNSPAAAVLHQFDQLDAACGLYVSETPINGETKEVDPATTTLRPRQKTVKEKPHRTPGRVARANAIMEALTLILTVEQRANLSPEARAVFDDYDRSGH